MPGSREVWRVLGFVLGLWGLLAAPGVRAQSGGVPGEAVELGDNAEVRVELLPTSAEAGLHGYFEYRFWVQNRSNRDVEVTLVLPKDLSTGGLRELRRSVRLAPEASAEVALLQPPVPVMGFGLGVRLDGRRQDASLPWRVSHPEYFGHSGTPVPLRFLLGRGVGGEELLADLGAEIRGVRAETAASAWSGNWLAYSSFDAIALTGDDLSRSGAEVETALGRWIEAGGTLVTVGPGAVRSLDAVRGDSAVRGAGRFQIRRMGFGVSIALESAAGLDELSAEEFDALRGHARVSLKPWDPPLQLRQAHGLLAVGGRLAIPVRALFALLLGFALVVGPLNTIVLTRARRRLWIYWTVPAISFVACAAIFLWAFLSEGLLREHRRQFLSFLDQGRQEAVTLALSGYYATLTPSDGLRFDLATEVEPIRPAGDFFTDGGTIVAGRDQHFASGWLRARSPAYFRLRRAGPRRERLAVRPTGDGGWRVLNGLGADVEELWLADPDGAVFGGGPLAAGAEVELSPAGRSIASTPRDLRELYGGRWSDGLDELLSAPVEFLEPGTYVARLEASPLLEPGLAEVDREEIHGAIFGLWWGGDPR